MLAKSIYMLKVSIYRYKVRDRMIDAEREVVPGLSAADVKEIADQILTRTDGNHPRFATSENGFLDILQKGTSDISATSAFIKKVSL